MKRTIEFASIKGGVGRTILSDMYAMHLYQKGIPVRILRFQNYKDNEISPIPITYFPYYDQEEFEEQLNSFDGITLIDIKYAGNCEDIIPADTLVIPFNYNSAEIDSTDLFLENIEDYEDPIVFIPNRIRYIGDWAENQDYKTLLCTRKEDGKEKGEAIIRYTERGYITKEILDDEEIMFWTFGKTIPPTVEKVFKDLDVFMEFLICTTD